MNAIVNPTNRTNPLLFHQPNTNARQNYAIVRVRPGKKPDVIDGPMAKSDAKFWTRHYNKSVEDCSDGMYLNCAPKGTRYFYKRIVCKL